jgi:secreted Zn-dependent insulinase-like peptidase
VLPSVKENHWCHVTFQIPSQVRRGKVDEKVKVKVKVGGEVSAEALRLIFPPSPFSSLLFLLSFHLSPVSHIYCLKLLHIILVCKQDKNYPKKAEDYISHLVGHEGKGSLLSALKSRGLATELSAGVTEGGYDRNTNVYLMNVCITLTEKGVEDCGLAAVALLFQYLKMLREQEPER